jgi:hypothetical protein
MQTRMFEGENKMESSGDGSRGSGRGLRKSADEMVAGDARGNTAPASQTFFQDVAVQSNWPILTMFLIALLIPILYFVGVVFGFLDWAPWLPGVVSSGFIAWVLAVRIQERHCQDSREP